MPAYIVAELDWKNDDALQTYLAGFWPALQAYGGKVLLAGAGETLEGDWRPPRLVILEFENAARARQWYASPEYGEIKELRHRNCDSKVVILGE